MGDPILSSDDDYVEEWLGQFAIAAVVPAFRVEKEIAEVLRSLPAYVRHVIVVNDASPDGTRAVVDKEAAVDDRVVLLNHETNQGVGGAMVTGFRKALELRAQVVVKIDGDGQMSPLDLPRLLVPLVRGEADYTKGNRFRDFRALRRMPSLRRLGNIGLSFLAKAATGYWTCFDPTNGFVAVRAEVLRQLPLEKIDRTYFFETSMLGQLYLLGAKVRDVALPARYGQETSNLSIRKVLWQFPGRLFRCFARRLILKNYVYDFTMESIYLLFGLPTLLAGVLYGGSNWLAYAARGVGAPTGTVVISALLIILSFQMLLAAIAIDLEAVPAAPLCQGPLREDSTPARPRGARAKAVERGPLVCEPV
jgi:glycosyltransferase involved in cell wall biosynthesis